MFEGKKIMKCQDCGNEFTFIPGGFLRRIPKCPECGSKNVAESTMSRIIDVFKEIFK